MKNRPSWHSASKAEWKEACRREAVIRPLVVEGFVSNARADQASKELGVSRSLVYRLVARIASGRRHRLCCRFHGDAPNELSG